MDFVAGCLGGCAGVLVGHPFDTVKVRLQCQHVANPMYTGTAHCFKQIVKKESVFGLYKGMASPMYGLAAINAIVFGVQANVQRRLSNPDSLGSHFIAGAVAGFAQCSICGPMELAKTIMQTQGQGESREAFNQTKRYTGPIDCLKKIYKAEGFHGTMRGMGLTIARETPSFGVYFATYEFLCRRLEDPANDNKIPLVSLILAGGVTGMVTWVTTYPIDVIKSRIQGDVIKEYSGALDCFQKTYAEQGWKGFYRGLNATLVRAFPVNAATLTTVTLTLRVWRGAKEMNDGGYEISAVMEHIPAHHLTNSTVSGSVISSVPNQHT